MRRIALFALIALSSLSSVVHADPHPPYKILTIQNPKIGGIPLDICLTWAKDCGKPAADTYCANIEYDYASAYAVNTDSGYTKLPSGEVCHDTFCDSFASITCKKEL